MKKQLVLLYVLLFLIAICCINVSVGENVNSEHEIHICGDYSYVVLEDGTAEIINFSGSADELVIPDVLDGIAVTSIGNQAFYGNQALTSVKIPSGVTAIGEYAFSGCISMISATIPDSVVSIMDNSFTVCDNLIGFVVSPDNPYLAAIDGVLFSKSDRRLIMYPRGLPADSYIVPNGIQIIGQYAFAGCKFLSSVTIPNSVTSIGKNAFANCTSLTSATIPSNVISIGEYSFDNCSLLTMTVDHDSYALQYCKNYGIKYTYPDSLDWLNN